MTRLAELRELLEKATPGPWVQAGLGWEVHPAGKVTISDDREIAACQITDDAAAIAAMRNSYEALLDVAEAADRALREWTYGNDLDVEELRRALARITVTDGNTRE